MKKVIQFIKNNKKKVVAAIIAVVALAGVNLKPELVEAVLNLITGAAQ